MRLTGKIIDAVGLVRVDQGSDFTIVSVTIRPPLVPQVGARMIALISLMRELGLTEMTLEDVK